MNSKKRVRAALAHKEPDYVPSYMATVPETMARLLEHYDLDCPDALLDLFDIDIRSVTAPYVGPELPTRLLSDGNREYTHWLGYRYGRIWNGVEYNNHETFLPLESASTPEEVDDHGWPRAEDFDYEELKRQCDRYPDRALRIGWPGVFQVAAKLVGDAKLYMDMASNPDFAHRLFDRMVEFELEYYGRMLEAADGQIDILCVCDDYGTQNGLLFSVEMWREYFAENTRRLANLAHQHGAVYMQHSCGAVRPIIPELIACGVDALDPVQKVTGMEPESLKQDFGDKLCFHGGIDTQRLLPLATPEEVFRETEYYIEVLNRDGGYILCGSQTLEGDIPLANIQALYGARGEDFARKTDKS